MTQFQNQTVLIVGGSSGIGAATALAFAAAGARVTIAARNAERLAAVASRDKGRIDTALLDMTDAAAVEAFFAQRPDFDHVVVSAAQTASGPVRKLPLADARRSMDSKFWGAYGVARAARITPGGSLTFVSGFLSVRPSKTAVLQGAINAALETLASGLALELAPVRVNTVSPGMVNTPIWDRLPDDARQATFDAAAKRLPAGRVGEADDIAQAILFLAGNGYATGSTVRVDGGGAIA
ncbi:SDR family oxidoreductase [Ideonella azotifigens]|uniref:SDR family oxidoreductase n=1 Tax=Ideonella azotifigens TaxID=513160 RepID=A0ABN1JKB4_9BURK|nr:SDR family oxidoreductase [Ideonella azotifigens]MCD2341859.1 SDR family oxidoreductase [Ideonella azotifigens]